jgi:hypothetical protein
LVILSSLFNHRHEKEIHKSEKAPDRSTGLFRSAVLNSDQTHALNAPAPVVGAVAAALRFVVSVCMMAGP